MDIKGFLKFIRDNSILAVFLFYIPRVQSVTYSTTDTVCLGQGAAYDATQGTPTKLLLNAAGKTYDGTNMCEDVPVDAKLVAYGCKKRFGQGAGDPNAYPVGVGDTTGAAGVPSEGTQIRDPLKMVSKECTIAGNSPLNKECAFTCGLCCTLKEFSCSNRLGDY